MYVARRLVTHEDIKNDTFDKLFTIAYEEFGKPPTNPPAIEVIGNLVAGAFTVDTDQVFMKMPVPGYDHSEAGGIYIQVIWTNDGGTDDNGKNVKFEISYLLATEGDVVSGSSPGSPKTVEDTYVGGVGHVEHHTGWINIPQSELDGKYCLFIRLMAVTPSGTPLTAEPRVLGVCFKYLAKMIPGF